jgi:beta-galactosidase
MKKINFNSEWKFRLNEGEWREVHLPHDYSIEQPREANSPSKSAGGFFVGGVGEYEKTFVSKKGKKYFFICEGSFGITEVFINANSAYINKYGYNSFTVDLTDFLRYDKENTILVRVDQTHLPNARWFTGAGLYRDTFLAECGDTYLDDSGVFVQTLGVENGVAYLNAQTYAHTEKPCEAEIEFFVRESGKKQIVSTFKKFVYLSKGKTTVNAKFNLENAKIWDVDTPNMYEITATIKANGKTDSEKSPFGIRTVYIDSKKGFILNGKSVKLRGGCVHHDQGPLGSATYKDAEYRRIARLKQAGFNAVRCSHNPQSQHFYDACDRLGMLVMDELFDYWTEGKQMNDSHIFFAEHYLEWTEQIVNKNRTHPSIVMFSTGNEIPQKAGRGHGYEIARNIADKIREIDPSRPVTHALCSLWDNAEAYEKERQTDTAPASEMDYFAEVTKITADTVDIVGYNYLEYRIERDLIRFPERVIINTETFPMNAYTTIKQLKNNPRIAGDFVWTAWDYFGETGIGHVDYDEKVELTSLLEYPYHMANCGDIDICGVRRPQSFYREIAWGIRKAPYITARHPKLTERKHFPGAWGFYECEPCWTFDGYEGKNAEIYIFAECDRLILELNGKQVGIKDRSEDGVYMFTLPYEAGTLCAKAEINGKIVATSTLKTVGKPSSVALKKEKNYLVSGSEKPKEEIVYIELEIQDENGQLCPYIERDVSFEAQNATVMALASSNLISTEPYITTERKTYNGKLLAVVKKQRGKSATVTATVDGFGKTSIAI